MKATIPVEFFPEAFTEEAFYSLSVKEIKEMLDIICPPARALHESAEEPSPALHMH
jgi:hypothetical protein